MTQGSASFITKLLLRIHNYYCTSCGWSIRSQEKYEVCPCCESELDVD